jgi:hypothetical protein
MPVSTSTFTTNSVQIIVSNESDSTNTINAVNAAIVRLGWTLFDSIATTAFNPITTYVYRVINADATTFKYCIIRWDTVKLVFYLSCAEDWVNGAPVNESWTGGGAFIHGYDLVTSSILVSASARHIMIWPYINNQPGVWSGIWEFERVAGEDISGVPCFAYTNSLMVGTPWGQTLNTFASNICFAFPRTADGFIGAAAANIYAPVTNRGMMPPAFPQTGYVPGAVASPITGDTNQLHLASYHNVTYGWNPLASVVSPVSADATTKSMPFGRAFNWGVTKPMGAGLDTTTVTGDAIGGWPTGQGTSTNYLLLAMNGGAEADAAYAVGKSTLTTGTAASVILGRPLQIGSTVWLPASDGIRTYDIGSGQGGTTTLRFSNASGIQDIAYDGQRSVYGSTINGVVRLDIYTFTSTSITSITPGTSYLNVDNKYVYAVSRTASITPTCYMINRSTFTVNAGVYTLGTALTAASGFGTPMPSYTGTVYVATEPGTVANAMRISNFTADNGTQINIALNPRPGSGGGIQSDCATGFYMDRTSNRLFCATSTATNGQIFEIAQPSLVTAGTVATFGAITTGTGYSNGTYLNVRMTTVSGPVPVETPVVNITVASGGVTSVALVAGRGGLGVATTTVLGAPTAVIGAGTGFSIPVATLVATPTFTTGVTGVTLQSHLNLATTADARGDLQFTPFRGTIIISPRQVGRAQASYATKVNFAHPSTATPGQPRVVFSSAANMLTYPGGTGSGQSSNGVYLVGTNFLAAASNFVSVVTNVYNLTTIAGQTAGRILLKA